MKNLFKLLLIFFISFAFIQNANAVTLNEKDLNENITKAIKADLEKYNLTKIDVKILHLTYSKMDLPDGKYIFKVSTNAYMPTAKMYYKLSVFVDNKLYYSMGVPVEVKAYKDVLVTNKQITRNALITPASTTVKNVDIAALVIQGTLSKDDLQKEIVSTKLFREGEVLDKRFIKIKPDIAQNAPVRAIFKSGENIEIVLDTFSLAEGSIGDYIPVKCDKYKKVYSGKIIGHNKVLIQI